MCYRFTVVLLYMYIHNLVILSRSERIINLSYLKIQIGEGSNHSHITVCQSSSAFFPTTSLSNHNRQNDVKGGKNVGKFGKWTIGRKRVCSGKSQRKIQGTNENIKESRRVPKKGKKWERQYGSILSEHRFQISFPGIQLWLIISFLWERVRSKRMVYIPISKYQTVIRWDNLNTGVPELGKKSSIWCS